MKKIKDIVTKSEMYEFLKPLDSESGLLYVMILGMKCSHCVFVPFYGGFIYAHKEKNVREVIKSISAP